MPEIYVNGVRLYYEQTGAGTPLIFVHEFAGDMRSWEPQVRYFSRRFRVVSYNQRGYPPSQVPDNEAEYSHDALINDLHALMDGLAIDRAHIAGLATGGNIALNFGIRHPTRVESLVVAGAGAGTTNREQWLKGAARFADDIEHLGTDGVIANVENAPQRVIFRDKDPRGFSEFIARMRDFSATGCMHLMRNALMNRQPVFELREGIEQLSMPVLVMVGDQDEPAFDASRFVAQHAPRAGLAVFPMCGHTLNSEEPALFNQLVEDFLARVEANHWTKVKA